MGGTENKRLQPRELRLFHQLCALVFPWEVAAAPIVYCRDLAPQLGIHPRRGFIADEFGIAPKLLEVMPDKDAFDERTCLLDGRIRFHPVTDQRGDLFAPELMVLSEDVGPDGFDRIAI